VVAASPRTTSRPAANTPGTDLVKKAGTLTAFIETYQGDFARVMPAHVKVEAFVGLATAYVRRDTKLHEAANVNPASLILALRECAALGHTPMPKIFALVPFNDKTAPGGKSIVGIETYHGVIERMYRAGGVQAVKCELVRKTDRFRFDPLQQRVTVHEYDPFATTEERGPLMGTYAWAVLFNGQLSQMVWLNREEVMKHMAVARTDKFWQGPWEPEMWKKTAVHVLERWVPTSAAYRWEVALSGAAAATGFVGVPDVAPREWGPSPDDIEDAVVVDDQRPYEEPNVAQFAPPDQMPAPAEGWPATRRPPDAPPMDGDAT